MQKNNKPDYKSAFTYLFKLIKPYKKWYVTAALISLILTVTGLLNTRVTQMLIDYSIKGELSKIISSLLIFIIIISANISLNYISGVFVSKLSAKASMDLKRHIGSVLLHARYGEIIKLRSGDTLSSLNSDTDTVCEFIKGDFIGLFSQFTMALGSILYLISYSPYLAAITFIYTPIGMFFTLSLNRKMNSLYSLNADYQGNALSVVEQALCQIPVIKSFVMEVRVKNRIFEQYDRVYKNEMKISVWNSLMQPACSSTSQIPRIIFMIFAGYMVMKGKLTAGAFISIFDLLTFIIGPSVYFPFILNGFNRSIASMNRIKRFDSIDQFEDGVRVMDSAIPQININDISFCYSDSMPIIQRFSLFHSGYGIISICGESGCGKTTLLDLISGLYKPQLGKINITGKVSVVTQDTYLFSMPLIENVRLAKTEADDYEVIEALKSAGANEFARALPDGYYTMLGDGNLNLSGGQMQRISLARTILSDSNIWLLDEPTSALDPETENIILNMIRKMSKEKLIIISAHRKSLIEITDKVINLKGAQKI